MAMATSEIEQVTTLINRSTKVCLDRVEELEGQMQQAESKVRTLYALMFIVTVGLMAAILIIAFNL